MPIEHKWRRELQLVVSAARPRVSAEACGRVRALAGASPDWPMVMGLAEEHGVRPLLYRTLNACCPELVPEGVLDALVDFVRADVAHNLLQNGELVALLKGLDERGIPAIPFKGSILAEWAYDDPSVRESGDIDIVIRRRHLRETVTYLLARDYRPRSGKNLESVTDENLGRYLRFDRIDGLASVDLQTSLEAPHFSFPLDNDELWNRAVPRTLAGESVLSFGAEDLFILLCVHGTKDVWFKLKWVCDIAGFIEREQGMNWDLVLARATRLGARKKLLLGCLLAHDWLGAALPKGVLDSIHRARTVVAAADGIAHKVSQANRRFTDAERATLYFRTEDPRERADRILRYLRRSVGAAVTPSENDRRWLPLPGWLSPLYCVVRPVRMLAQFAARPRSAAKAVRDLFESLD